MAQIPYNPVPSVPAEGVPARSSDRMDVRAFPDAFGVDIGRATQQLGGEIGQAGQQFLQAGLAKAQLQNELIANDANTNAMQEVTDRYSAFTKLEGQAAQAGLDQYRQDIKGIYTKYISAMPNLETQKMLSGSLRYMGDYYMRVGTAHADQEWKTWADRSAIDGAREFGNQAAIASRSDPTDMRIFLNSSDDQISKLYEQRGWDQQSIAAEVAKNRGANLRNIVETVAKEDPMKAEGIFKAYEKEIDAGSRLQITTNLDPLVKQLKAKVIAPNYMGTNLPSPAGAFSNEQIANAINWRESNGNPNAPTSVNGAIGGWQIRPGTFDQYKHAGEVITNPTDNEAVGRRIITDLSNKFGGDPARIAVGYFSGEGNVSPAGSPTPWIRDVADGNGKLVSSYVGDVTARLGAMSKAGIKVDEATALQNVDKDFANDPALARYVKAELHQQYATATMQAAATEAQRVDANNKAADGYVQAILQKKDPTQIMSGIANDPNLNWETRWRLTEMAGHGTTNEEHDLKTYGPGFYQAYQAVHAPQDDPSRITDRNQLYSRVGPSGDLTVAGVDKLVQEMEGKKTPDGEAEGEMKKQFFANAKAQISGSNEGLHIRDPKGDDLFLKFMARALPAYDEGRKAGKSPSQLLDPDSKDYIGSAIKSFKRPMAQWVHDMLAPELDTPAEGADLTTRDAIVKAYQAGRITRERAGQALTDIGIKFDNAPPPAVQVPATGGSPVPVQ